MTDRSAAIAATEEGSPGFWRRLVTRFRPGPIETAGAFTKFVEERASLIAQKCAVDYCRGKTGLASYALFTEKPFLDAFEICRWESFAAVLGDLFIVAEGYLRPHVAPQAQEALHANLVRRYTAILAGMPYPVHRPHGWDDAVASFTLRLQSAMSGKPRQALDVADHSAKTLFDTLPIHSRMRELDEEVVYGAVRFRMIAVSQEMQRRFNSAAIARALLEA